MSDTYAILLAAGRGTRFGENKVAKDLAGRPVWRWSYDTLAAHPEIHGVVVVCGDEIPDDVWSVPGGATRQASVRAGIDALPDDARYAVIHDAARPFISTVTLSELLEVAHNFDGVAPAVPLTDTVRNSGSLAVVDRETLVAMQTPQVVNVFRYRQALENGGEQTDDLAVLQAAGMAVTTIPGDPDAFKITHPADWDRAETLARRERALSGDYDLAGSVMPETRTGLGYDVHRFSLEPDRPMMLGGIFFQDVTGLDGHSDADVVLHAVVDALLGAAALGDIGMHFPPSDPKWHNAPSIKFLDFAVNEIRRLNWRIVHLDIAVIAESPKIMPRAIEIRTTIAEAAGITLDRVSIKATTNERMGFVGRGEGIACHAVATIARP